MSEPQPAPPKPTFEVHPLATEQLLAQRRNGLETLGVALVVAAWLVGVATAVLLAVLYDALQDAELGVLGSTATQSGWVRFFTLAIGGVVATLLLGAAGALLRYVSARDRLEATTRSTGSAVSVDAEPNAL